MEGRRHRYHQPSHCIFMAAAAEKISFSWQFDAEKRRNKLQVLCLHMKKGGNEERSRR